MCSGLCPTSSNGWDSSPDTRCRRSYYEKVGPEGFEKAPIGSGPYMVDQYERNAFLRLKANPKYWGGKPAFETVIFKFVPDATSRVAEVESGSSDVTFYIPYEEYDRLRQKPGLIGATTPVSDIGMIFISNRGVMLDRNVRLAASHAIDKEAIVKRLLRGYGVPLSTLEAPEYLAYDAEHQSGIRSSAGNQAARRQRLFAPKAGLLHDPDDPRLHA